MLIMLSTLIMNAVTAQSGPGGGNGSNTPTPSGPPPELVFTNPVLKSGNANQEGATYRFSNVMTGVDAEVKLKKFSRNDIVMQDVDLASLGWDKAFQPKFGLAGTVAGNLNWYVDFELTFYKAGTNQKQHVQQFDLTALDVDGDGQSLSEYVKMDNANSVSYSTISSLTGSGASTQEFVCPLDGNASPIINCPTCHGTGTVLLFFQCDDCDGSGKIYQECGHPCASTQEADGPVENFLNIDTAATQVMATYHYINKDKITFRIGAKTGAAGTTGDAGIRLNSLWYRQFNLAPAVVLPVKLTGFSAVRDGSSKVLLNWSTATEKNFDHFTVQRSTDGKEYRDIALVFAGEEASGIRNYQYKDVPTNATVIFYRLQMVDRSGEIAYSPVRMIRMDQASGSVQLVVAPNPVADELHLTLPAAWQGQAVTLEVYSINGVRMQQVQLSKASQTEEIRMGNLPKGAYLVKAYSNGQTVQQRVIHQ